MRITYSTLASQNHGPYTPPHRRFVLLRFSREQFRIDVDHRLHRTIFQLADWLEFYAEALELNIWTSSTVTKAVRDENTGKWAVTVKKADGAERVFHVDHVVFALGLGAGNPKIPDIPGKVSITFEIILWSRNRACFVGGVPGSGSSLNVASFGKGPPREEGCHPRCLHFRCVCLLYRCRRIMLSVTQRTILPPITSSTVSVSLFRMGSFCR